MFSLSGDGKWVWGPLQKREGHGRPRRRLSSLQSDLIPPLLPLRHFLSLHSEDRCRVTTAPLGLVLWLILTLWKMYIHFAADWGTHLTVRVWGVKSKRGQTCFHQSCSARCLSWLDCSHRWGRRDLYWTKGQRGRHSTVRQKAAVVSWDDHIHSRGSNDVSQIKYQKIQSTCFLFLH